MLLIKKKSILHLKKIFDYTIKLKQSVLFLTQLLKFFGFKKKWFLCSASSFNENYYKYNSDTEHTYKGSPFCVFNYGSCPSLFYIFINHVIRWVIKYGRDVYLFYQWKCAYMGTRCPVTFWESDEDWTS